MILNNELFELKYIIKVLFTDILQIESPFYEQFEEGFTLSYGGDFKLRISGCCLLNLDFTSELYKLNMKSVDGLVYEIIGHKSMPALETADNTTGSPLISYEGNVVTINFDLFGSAFYILTRMEERDCNVLDEHGRFPASASHA